ncbi:hypothetical protein ACHQM5_003785 [Ranunculus cassubicifolius]
MLLWLTYWGVLESLLKPCASWRKSKMSSELYRAMWDTLLGGKHGMWDEAYIVKEKWKRGADVGKPRHSKIYIHLQLPDPCLLWLWKTVTSSLVSGM